MIAISQPFPQFFEADGSPLDNGYVYIGTANLDPETNPISAYWDQAGTIPATLPARTLNGYVVNGSTPSNLYVNSAYSMRVKTAGGTTVFTMLDSTYGVTSSVLSELANTTSATKGAGLVGFSSLLSYAAGTVGGFLKSLSSTVLGSDGAKNIGIRRSGVTSTPTNLHDWIEALPFRNALTDYGTIQAAIDAANAAGGGKVVIPRKASGWNLGTTGLTLYSNVILEGEVEPYVASTRGVELVYSGSGSAISGVSLLNVHVRHLSIDCTAATGAAVTGMFFDGIWLSSFSDIRIKGATAWKGYGILVRTGAAAGPWGAQHVTFDRIECPDGIIRLEGPSPSDGVTTTVLNTVRGYQYEFQNAQGALINCTSEIFGVAYNAGTTYAAGAHVLDSGVMYVAKQSTTGNAVSNGTYWRPLSGYGMLFEGAGTNMTVMACDMEGNLPAGVSISGNASVREAGAGWIWNGFSGANRVTGSTDTARSYGGSYEWIGPLAVGTPVTVETFGNQNLPSYLEEQIVPVNVTGGSQDAYRRWYRYINGTKVLTHEFQRNALVEHSKDFSATSAQTVLQILIPTGRGVQVDCQVEGVQIGDQSFSIAQRVVARNNSGTVTFTADTALSIPGGYGGAFSFVASGNYLQIKYTPTTSNASTLQFSFHVRGGFSSFIKG
jgi:hypothetical protein